MDVDVEGAELRHGERMLEDSAFMWRQSLMIHNLICSKEITCRS